MLLLLLYLAYYSQLDFELPQHLRAVVTGEVVHVFLCRLEVVMQLIHDFIDRAAVVQLLRSVQRYLQQCFILVVQ